MKIIAGLLSLLLIVAFIYGCGDTAEIDSNKTVSSLSLSPTSASVEVSSHVAFSASAYYSDGTALAVIPAWTVSNTIGTIEAQGYTGYFTANLAGTGTVTATYSGKSASSIVTVTGATPTTPPSLELASISINPAATNARVSSETIFVATGKNASNETVPCSPFWTISGETVGVFTSSGLIATLESTSEGYAIIKCASGEIFGNSYATIEGYTVEITVETDTYVDEANPTVSYGAETTLKSGYSTAAPVTRYETYLFFSLTSLPSNITIESVTLKVFPTAAPSTAIQIFKLSSGFTDGTTWNTKPNSSDFLLLGVNTAGDYNQLSGAALTDAVKSWYATPLGNYGIVFRQDAFDNGVLVLLSGENSSNQPMLSINYKK